MLRRIGLPDAIGVQNIRNRSHPQNSCTADTPLRQLTLALNPSLLCAVPESSGVWTFVVDAELAVQSQQRRTTVHDTHSCSQHCLVLEQVGLELALE